MTWTVVAQSAPPVAGDLYSSGTTWGGTWSEQVPGNSTWGVSGGALWYSPSACVSEGNYPQHIQEGVSAGDAEFFYETLIPSLGCQPQEDSVLIFRNVACNRYFTLRLDHFTGSDACMQGKVSRLSYDKLVPTGNPCGTPGVQYGTFVEGVGSASIDCVQKNTWYRVRLRVCGDRLMAKAWPALSVEPAAWQLTATDPDLVTYSSGSFGFQANQGQTAFRNLTISSLGSGGSVTVTDALSGCMNQVSLVGPPSQGSAFVSGSAVTWVVGDPGSCGDQAALTLSSVITGCAGYPVSNVANCTGGGYASASVSVVAGMPTSTPTPTNSVPITLTVQPTWTQGVSQTATPQWTRTATGTPTPTSTFFAPVTNTATWTNTPANLPLTVVKSESATMLSQGAPITYSIRFSLPGTTDPAAVTLTDYLPDGLTYFTQAGGGMDFVRNGQTLTWTKANPGPGYSNAVTVMAVAGCPASGSVSNYAVLSADQVTAYSNGVVAQVNCPTSTRTPSPTMTVTNSVPITLTVQPTWTQGVSQTATPQWTRTATGTPTPTSTFFAPVTNTATWTPTRTPTATPTETETRTGTATPSPVVDPPATATLGPAQAAQASLPYPNPSRGLPVAFKVEGGPFDQASLAIYSLSGRLVSRTTRAGHGETEMVMTWDLLDSSRKNVGNGLYHAVIETTFRGHTTRFKKTVVLLR